MINYLTRLKVADSCGVREIQCIKVLGGSFIKMANAGKLLVIIIKRIDAKIKKLKRGLIYRALLVRTACIFFRGCGI